MFKKINTRGMSHHLLLPVLAVFLVAAIGGLVMTRNSSAATFDTNCSKTKVIPYKASKPYTKGECVRNVQKKLIDLGYLPKKNAAGKTNADGIYGPATKAAIRAFQVRNRLETTGLGPNTYTALQSKTALGKAKVVAQKTTPKTNTSCKYKRYNFTSIFEKAPVKPANCKAGSVALRQYAADIKAFNIMKKADEISTGGGQTIKKPNAAATHITANCKGDVKTQTSDQWDLLVYGPKICVSKVLK